MPHLVLFNRYWRISSDDLPIPMMAGMVFRIIRAMILAVSLGADIVQQEGSCNYGLISYLSSSLVLCFLLSLTASMCIRTGMSGTVVDNIDRDLKMRPILVAHGSLLFIEIGCACWGLAIFINRSSTSTVCDMEVGNLVLVLLGIAVIFQLLNAGILSCCCLATYLRRVDDEKLGNMKEEKEAESVWLSRINKVRSFARCFSCTILGGSHIVDEDLEAASRLFTLFFHHEGFLDLVPGDVFVGLLLVRLEQRSLLMEQVQLASSLNKDSNAINASIANGLTTDDIDVSSTLSEVDGPAYKNLSRTDDNCYKQNDDSTKRMLRPRSKSKKGTMFMDSSEFLEGQERSIYANKAHVDKRRLLPTNQEDRRTVEDILHYIPYSLSSYTYFLAVMYPCTCGCRICASCIGSNGNEVVDGDFCWVNKATALHSKRKRQGDLVYANFENTLLLSPYLIFLDQSPGRDDVIISIRGTMSIEDIVLDITSDPVDATEIFKEHGVNCHEPTFCHGGVLKSALFMLEHFENKGNLSKIIRRRDGTDRKLVIVGHSLGAALATILTVLVRGKYSKARGMCYAPLGMTIDQIGAHDYKDCITSVVYGDDLCPSLNYSVLINLRERVLDCLARTKVNKNYIAQCLYKDFELNQLLYEHEEATITHKKFVDSTKQFKEHVHGKYSQDKRPQLTLAGRIFHFMVEDEARSCLCEYPVSVPYEVHQDAFLEMKVSKTMVLDHQISAYYRGLIDIDFFNLWCESVSS